MLSPGDEAVRNQPTNATKPSLIGVASDIGLENLGQLATALTQM